MARRGGGDTEPARSFNLSAWALGLLSDLRLLKLASGCLAAGDLYAKLPLVGFLFIVQLGERLKDFRRYKWPPCRTR